MSTILFCRNADFSDQAIDLNFYQVQLSVSPAGSGVVSGAGSYMGGSYATIQASPDPGYAFSKWSDNNTENPRRILVNSNINLQAIFEEKSITDLPSTAWMLNYVPDNSVLSVGGRGAISIPTVLVGGKTLYGAKIYHFDGFTEEVNIYVCRNVYAGSQEFSEEKIAVVQNPVVGWNEVIFDTPIVLGSYDTIGTKTAKGVGFFVGYKQETPQGNGMNIFTLSSGALEIAGNPIPISPLV